MVLKAAERAAARAPVRVAVPKAAVGRPAEDRKAAAANPAPARKAVPGRAVTLAAAHKAEVAKVAA